MNLSLEGKAFGELPSGEEIKIFTLSLADKISLSVINYGATWTHLFLPDANGKIQDVLLGFDTLEGFIHEEYQKNYCYIGSTVGRVAGRATDNKFILDGKTYLLPPNQGNTHLHGGVEGWDKKVWNYQTEESQTAIAVHFSYTSPDGEENYPGKINIKVSYKLDLTGKLSISYQATSNRKTVLNPTNHFYINLSGDFTKTIEGHTFQVNADKFLPMNDNSLPTGELKPVEETVFDFRNPKTLNSTIESDDEQVKIAGGIDHCFVLNKEGEQAILIDPFSKRRLRLYTTSPGLQVYTSNYLSGAFKGKRDIAFPKRSAICLETQFFPDSHNQAHFPSIVLDKGEVFDSSTSFIFDCIA
ncbi:aldose epimerase family protein [Arthrospiribacter ruber]|uniref:Aldose 1-epimerase n=1 Tax=Arthrospiribacter ruber TaxID=2487934 RepID=A0A951MBD8_9BACT|nr:aldose epimerase family protein [Arthrospiribacter ruber]MBW3467169.1 galactose mutarotase [Arthrospiribacter ruber]